MDDLEANSSGYGASRRTAVNAWTSFRPPGPDEWSSNRIARNVARPPGSALPPAERVFISLCAVGLRVGRNRLDPSRTITGMNALVSPKRPLRPAIFVVVFALVSAGCARRNADQSADPPSFRSLIKPGLENVWRVTDRIYSGGEPQGPLGFQSLEELGIRTVVSVDGATPDLEAARAHGIRYIHIPIGYEGISGETGKRLARVARETEGPIYVHCHHGRHRGPAAAAVTCLADGSLTSQRAVAFLESAGTGTEYKGLWRDVERFDPPAPDATLPPLVEQAAVGSFTAAMAAIDRSVDRLKECRAADWQAPAGQPEIIPQQEALLLREGFREAARDPVVNDAQFLQWLAESEAHARGLERALEAGDHVQANSRLQRVLQSCQQCHADYRD